MRLTSKKSIKFLFLFLFVALLSACDKEEEARVQVNFIPKFNQEVIDFSATYQNAQQQYFKVDLLAFYLSNIALIGEDEKIYSIEEIVLYDVSNPPLITTVLPAQNYKAITFNIGVDSMRNQRHPTEFPATHPLGNTSYYWGWATKYIFAKLEGKFTEDATTELFDNAYLYHLGLDSLYRHKEVTKPIVLQAEESNEVTVTINLNTVFDNLNLIETPTSQSFDDWPTAVKVMDKLTDSME